MLSSSFVAVADEQSPRPVQSLLEMRRDNVITQEWDLSCGAAALATLLTYQYGDKVSEKEVAVALMKRREYVEDPGLVQLRQGFSLLDLKRYVETRSYTGIGYGQLSFDDLIEKAPIITPINTFGYNHFVVFRGVAKNRVLMADPAWGNRTMTIDDFQHAWIDYGGEIGHVGFVVDMLANGTAVNHLVPEAKEFVTFN